ncbi:Zinc finger CCCH domain-containing protein 29 [Ananas comosus]|uniref:Zinc finger CCCH domain-containing protein 29 n=1 Tax=Ananas comosus TaxID=4615 RepID=A0A199V016_ANACO|nr:Zinc finger CCCH domain-containing protein 29 [Ananas comosus]
MNGIYSTDEFRMYAFKVKPCSRAYSHDWTKCPFVHPGENARRRNPRKFLYSCVPCPEFRKGSCRHGDACEYAHGVFESWLHPAQYRTRLSKDETGCARRVRPQARRALRRRRVHRPRACRSAPRAPRQSSAELRSGAPSPRQSFAAAAAALSEVELRWGWGSEKQEGWGLGRR